MDSARPALRKLNEVGRVGRLDLVFGVKYGRTVIRDAYSEVPCKITRLYYPEGSSLAQLVVMNTTAGLFGGDRTDIRIHVERGARILITSQASPRLHPGNGFAEQNLSVHVEAAAECHLYNDPLIPFRGARLRQRTNVQLESESRFCFWDGFMAGRVERGESWQFKEIDSETRLCRDGKLVYLERYRLDAIFPDFRYVGTGLFCQELPAAFFGMAGPNVGIDEPAPGIAVVRTVAQTGTQYREIQQRVVARAFAVRGEVVPNLRKN